MIGRAAAPGVVLAERAGSRAVPKGVVLAVLGARGEGGVGVQLESANANTDLAFTAVEQQDFRTDHAMVGCLLAQNWWLPEEICLAIRHHHDRSAIDFFDSGLPASSRYLVAASQTAEHIVQQLTGGSRTQEWSKLGSSCLRLLRLAASDLPELYRGAEAVLATVD